MRAPAFGPRVVLSPATYVRLPLPLHNKVRAVAHQHDMSYSDTLRAIVEAWAASEASEASEGANASETVRSPSTGTPETV